MNRSIRMAAEPGSGDRCVSFVPERIQSFPPVGDAGARILILGSMPGKASLEAQQYYAHPRNAFWRIVGQLLGFAWDLPYPQRLEYLRSRGIALWDVLHSCTRRSSLDADIEEASILPNEVGPFLDQHGAIGRVYFNGSKAEQAFRRYIAPTLSPQRVDLRCFRLPSTSPAHASLSFEQKLDAWQVLVRGE
ncbi:MAG: DNA-deoxyinosine glycosylase [Methylotetracoccus sp.]|jgi:hypoxanthine-DNA glycosylase|nr:DNA-deoxyinosine glycosylase [Methylotetracoccus sp.]